MILRFEVNQAEAFRRGINVERSTNHLDVNPSQLSQEERNLIADRLDGIDVCRLEVDSDGNAKRAAVWPEEEATTDAQQKTNRAARIMAKARNYEALMEAIRENQAEVERELAKRKPAEKELAERKPARGTGSALEAFLKS